MDDGEFDWTAHIEANHRAALEDFDQHMKRVRFWRLWRKLAIAALCAGAIAGAIWTRLH